jgi:hypothetical protein
MRKAKFYLVILAFWLVMVPLRVGGAHAYDNFTVQGILTSSANNYIGFVQGISGWNLKNFSESGSITVDFTNVTVGGLYNASYGLGSFKNLGTLTFLNVQPDLNVGPALFQGLMFSENNKVEVGDYNYSVNLNFNGFKSSGIVVFNLMAGSFSNQFTSVHFSMGKNVTPEPSRLVARFTPEIAPQLVQLSNAQMEKLAATNNNDFKFLGKQTAIATIEGVPQVQGVCAITLSSGVNNQISHRVGVNIDTGR